LLAALDAEAPARQADVHAWQLAPLSVAAAVLLLCFMVCHCTSFCCRFVLSSDMRLKRLKQYSHSPVTWFRNPHTHLILVGGVLTQQQQLQQQRPECGFRQQPAQEQQQSGAAAH
jgi:hypothetical protein